MVRLAARSTTRSATRRVGDALRRAGHGLGVDLAEWDAVQVARELGALVSCSHVDRQDWSQSTKRPFRAVKGREATRTVGSVPEELRVPQFP